MTAIINKTLAQYEQSFTVSYTYGDLLQISSRLIAGLTALVNIFIFMHNKILRSSEFFHYLLAISTADFLYMSVLAFSNIINKQCSSSSTQCNLSAEYFTFFLYISVNNWLSSSLAIFTIIIENFLTIQRLFMLANKRLPAKLTVVRVVLAVLGFSVVFYSPTGFTSQIVMSQISLVDANVTEYKMINTDFGNSLVEKVTPVVLSFIRLCLSGPILFGLNIYNIYVFKQYLNKKKSAKKKPIITVARSSSPSSNESENITAMLIIISMIFTLGNLPYMVYYSITQIAPSFQNTFMSTMNWLSRVCLSMLVILKVWVYFAYNKLYRKQLLEYLFLGRVSVRPVVDASVSRTRRMTTIQPKSHIRTGNIKFF
jgi:hypothetical protein